MSSMPSHGFQAHPPTIEAHADRTAQRADDVSGHAQQIGSTGLHPTALGGLGGGTISHANAVFQQASTSVDTMGGKLRGISGTEKAIAGRYQETEDSNKSLFSGRGKAKAFGKNTAPNVGTSAQGASRGGGGKDSDQALNGGKPYPGNPPVHVTVDNHQLKHQDGPLFNLDPKNTQKSGAAKFPGYVDESWHEKYFGPRTAKLSQDEINARMRPINDLRAEADEHDINAQNLKADGSSLVEQAKKAKKAGDSATSDQLMDQATALSKKYKDEQAAAEAARKRADEQEAQLKSTVLHPKKDTQPDDNVKYDIAISWDQQTQSWQSVYHLNPDIAGNDKATKGWWKNYGSAIADQYGLNKG